MMAVEYCNCVNVFFKYVTVLCHLSLVCTQNAGHICTNKVDIYAVGIVFLELLCPFLTDKEREDTLKKLNSLGFCDQFNDELSSDVS